VKLTRAIFYTSLTLGIAAQVVDYALRKWWIPLIPGIIIGLVWGLAAWKNRRGLNTLLFLCMVAWNALGFSGNENPLLPIISGTFLIAAWNAFDFLSRLRQYSVKAGNPTLERQYALRLVMISVVALSFGGAAILIRLQLRFELALLLVILGFIGLSQLVRYLVRSRDTQE
jgi:multisubunit Na+/H+ antiporter MnhF subunit